MAETPKAQQMLDQEMIARIGRRDQSAFSALYDRLSGPLYSLAVKMLGDPAEAQDALQDAYDHLLFLFGLLLVAGGFYSALNIITSFTIAHSITPAVATLRVVQIPSRIVEPLIAASIVVVGVENLLRGEIPKSRRLLTFGFGLIHGFGFASALREAGIASSAGGIVLPLFSFNLGVELGQVMVAAVTLPIIWKLRENPIFIARWTPTCSAAVVLLGSFWFVERVWMA